MICDNLTSTRVEVKLLNVTCFSQTLLINWWHQMAFITLYKSYTQQFTALYNNLFALDAESCCHCRIEHLTIIYITAVYRQSLIFFIHN